MSTLTPDDVLLGLLAERTRHGYELLAAFRDPAQLGRVWTLSTSQLYAVLKRLEAGEYIVGRQFASENAPTRTEYAVTQLGARRLYEWLHKPPSASVRRVRVEFLSRLYVAQALNVPVRPLIAAQRAACLGALALLQAETCTTPMHQLADRFQIAQLEAILRWLDGCQQVLAATEHDRTE
jgi:DNA-binding PadR family transcriptional regulator